MRLFPPALDEAVVYCRSLGDFVDAPTAPRCAVDDAALFIAMIVVCLIGFASMVAIVLR